jgi:hypothetical protein
MRSSVLFVRYCWGKEIEKERIGGAPSRQWKIQNGDNESVGKSKRKIHVGRLEDNIKANLKAGTVIDCILQA